MPSIGAEQGNPQLKTNVATRLDVHFLVLATGSVVSAVGFAALQERVFKTPGFNFQGWMTLLTYVTFAACGWVETRLRGQYERHAKLQHFLGVSLLAMGGNYLTTWGTLFLHNYTTRIVFKSCRILPTMALRTLIVGRRYSGAQYGAGAVLVAGIALFTLGDASAVPEFNGIGVLLMSLALVCDALTSNVEERHFFRIASPCSHGEVMMYMSSFAAAEVSLIMLATGELLPAVAHSRAYPATVPCILASSLLGYCAVSCILMLIQHYGSTSAEVVKSMRKVLQVAVSLLLYPKPLTWKHAVGGAAVICGLSYLQRVGKSTAADNACTAVHNAKPALPLHNKEVEPLLAAPSK